MPEGNTRSADATVYATLREAILSLGRMPGEHLSERGLESQLHASRTPIRAALVRLENEGLTRRKGRGWQVSPIDRTEIGAALEYREAIEIAAATRAIERATDDEIAAVAAFIHSPRDDREGVLRDGTDFHLAMARLSRNPFFVDAVEDAMTRLRRTRWLEVRDAPSRANAHDEHRGIIEAVASRDVEAATTLVVAHIRGTRDRLLTLLDGARQSLRAQGLAIVESSADSPPLMGSRSG